MDFHHWSWKLLRKVEHRTAAGSQISGQTFIIVSHREAESQNRRKWTAYLTSSSKTHRSFLLFLLPSLTFTPLNPAKNFCTQTSAAPTTSGSLEVSAGDWSSFIKHWHDIRWNWGQVDHIQVPALCCYFHSMFGLVEDLSRVGLL